MDAHILQMAQQLRTIAEQEIIPRFGKVKPQKKTARYKEEENVTEADLAASKALLAFARQHYPESFSEEELPQTKLTAQRLWVIDPVDGTDEFIAQVATGYVCQAALLERQSTGAYHSIAGIIYRPGTKELLFGTAQEVVYEVNGVQETLPKPQNQTTTGWVRGVSPDERVATWYKNHGVTAYQGGGAGACWMDMCTGKAQLSLFVSPHSKCWDTAPGEPLLAHLGGKLTNVLGQPLLYRPGSFYNQQGWLAQLGGKTVDTTTVPLIINA